MEIVKLWVKVFNYLLPISAFFFFMVFIFQKTGSLLYVYDKMRIGVSL